MKKVDKLEKIIRAYGKVLEDLSKGKNKWFLIPESKLPYPKEVIRVALEIGVEITKDKRLKEQLKISLIFLDDFVPDKEVPKDFIENLKTWAIRQKKLKSDTKN